MMMITKALQMMNRSYDDDNVITTVEISVVEGADDEGSDENKSDDD